MDISGFSPPDYGLINSDPLVFKQQFQAFVDALAKRLNITSANLQTAITQARSDAGLPAGDGFGGGGDEIENGNRDLGPAVLRRDGARGSPRARPPLERSGGRHPLAAGGRDVVRTRLATAAGVGLPSLQPLRFVSHVTQCSGGGNVRHIRISVRVSRRSECD